jgi:hypothetical protein
MNGNQYRDWVGNYIKSNFSARGINVYTEIFMGKSVIGKNRRVDVLVVDEPQNKAVALECKFQGSSGTTDEKVPYTLNDCESMQMDAYVIYGGTGWSRGIVHMLEANELASYACPKDEDGNDFTRTKDTKELDHLLAMRFSWWDIFTQGKTHL